MSKALTLSGLMALLLPKERLFVIHHLGADISEPDTPAPILLVTIGGKVKTHE